MFLKQLILPALSLGLVQGAVLTRYVRSAVLDVQREDYLRTARAKGLSPMAALRRHGLRNAAIPVVTVLGLQLATLLVGAVVVERVFVVPGLGSLLLDAVGQRDLRWCRTSSWSSSSPCSSSTSSSSCSTCSSTRGCGWVNDEPPAPEAGARRRRTGDRQPPAPLGPSLVVGAVLVGLDRPHGPGVVRVDAVGPHVRQRGGPAAGVLRRGTGWAPTSSAATSSRQILMGLADHAVRRRRRGRGGRGHRRAARHPRGDGLAVDRRGC